MPLSKGVLVQPGCRAPAVVGKFGTAVDKEFETHEKAHRISRPELPPGTAMPLPPRQHSLRLLRAGHDLSKQALYRLLMLSTCTQGMI